MGLSIRDGEGPLLGTREVFRPGQVRGPFELLRWLWTESSLRELRKCHRVQWTPQVEVVRSRSGEVLFRGFDRCHSVWSCPVCAPSIRAGRAAELSAGLIEWIRAGHGVTFLTATIPHNCGDALPALFSGVAASWCDVLADKSVKALRHEMGFDFVRSAEVTYGENGWHPHLHVCLVSDVPLVREDAKVLRDKVFRAWCAAVVRRGWKPPSPQFGLSVIKVSNGDVGQYMSKVEGLAQEMLRMDRKDGLRRTEAPFSILSRAVGGDVEAGSLWRVYEQGTKARKALTFSRGFHRRVDVVEGPDSELVGGWGGGFETLGYLDRSDVNLLVCRARGFEIFVESVADGTAEGWAAAIEALRGDVPWWMTDSGWEVEARELDRERHRARYGEQLALGA